MMKNSIVVLAYNHWLLTHTLLWDLFQHCKADEILVVNNGSTEQETVDGLSWWEQSDMFPDFRVVDIPKNIGFLLGANVGLKAAHGEIISLLSNDVRVRKNFMLNAHLWFADMSPKSLMGGKLYNQSTGWNEFDGRIFPYIEGWLLMTRKDGWEELGYFDTVFIPCDFEDVDLSTTAKSKGYELLELPAGMVEHIGAQTIGYGPERQAQTEINRQKFRDKWIGKNA